MDIRGKKVLLTGGARGLGRRIVEKLLAVGANVTVLDLDKAGLDDLSSEAPGVNCLACDVSDYEQVASTLTLLHNQQGALEVLINNAGILYSAPLVSVGPSGVVRHDVSDWHKVLAADLSSVFYVTSCVVEKMITTRTRGVVVNISSVSASGNAGQSAYSAAKAGVNALTATWAKELSMMGIRVVAVAPGFTDTESTHQALSENVLKETIKRVPLKRLGTPDEIANGVLHVIENDFFNGKVLELDGGLII